MTQKYRHTFRCHECGNTFKKISVKQDLEKASCPHCKKLSKERRLSIGDGAVSESDIAPPQVFIRTDKYSCNSCGKLLTFRVESEGDKMSHCYKCGSQDLKYMGQYVPQINNGNKTMIKALDIVAQDTMKTYAMTDVTLNSNMRPGDTSAPKLPPHQQKMVDGFFNHGNNPLFQKAGRNALAGAYRDPNNVVSNIHKAKAPSLLQTGKFIDATPGRK